MSNPTNQPTTETIRMCIDLLRNYHLSVVRSGDHRLRVAMAEYALQIPSPQERNAA